MCILSAIEFVGCELSWQACVKGTGHIVPWIQECLLHLCEHCMSSLSKAGW